MKNKKKILLSGILATSLFASLSVSAAGTTRGVSDCKPSITLNQTSGVFKIFEDVSPMIPNTPKRLEGTYTTIDINGNSYTQDVYGSLRSGQLVVTKYAPAHYQSKSARMAYYLNGTYCGSLSKTY